MAGFAGGPTTLLYHPCLQHQMCSSPRTGARQVGAQEGRGAVVLVLHRVRVVRGDGAPRPGRAAGGDLVSALATATSSLVLQATRIFRPVQPAQGAAKPCLLLHGKTLCRCRLKGAGRPQRTDTRAGKTDAGMQDKCLWAG